MLTWIQNDLVRRGCRPGHPIVDNPSTRRYDHRGLSIDRLETWCDEYNETLPALNSFILPGGTGLSALLHVARTVTRRAERSAWMAKAHPSPSARCRRGISTGSRTCCSSCRGWPTPMGTCSGSRAARREKPGARGLDHAVGSARAWRGPGFDPGQNAVSAAVQSHFVATRVGCRSRPVVPERRPARS